MAEARQGRPGPAAWYAPATVAAAAALSLALRGRLPARVATHWAADGTPNGWSSPAVAAWLLPAAMLGLLALFRALPAVDPRRANYARFAGAYDTIVNATLTLLLALHATVLAVALGHPVPVARVTPVAAGAMLAVFGNVLPRVRPNSFVGIRTPWTLADDRVWARTHRLAGHLFTAAGVLNVASGLFLAPRVAEPLILTSVVVAALGPAVYSAFAGPGDSPPRRHPTRRP